MGKDILNKENWIEEENEIDEQENEIDENEINYLNDSLSIMDIYNKYKRGVLVLPEIQREYNWNIKNASMLIDSILVGFPLPSIFLMEKNVEDLEGNLVKKMFIIDGGHRLRTIISFIEGDFINQTTKKFEIKNEKSKWNNESYETLSEQKRDDFEDYRLNCTIFKPKNRATWIYEIFRRINTNSNPLSPQELRESFFPGEYLRYIKDNKEKVQLWKENDVPGVTDKKYLEKHSKRFDKKSKGMELVLRVITYIRLFEKNGFANMDYSFNKNVVIDEYLKENYDDLAQSKNDFEMFINLLNKFEKIDKVFLWKDNNSYSDVLFESILLSASHISELPSWVTTENFMSFKNDLNKLDSFTKSTTSYTNVVKRILIIKYFFKLYEFSQYEFEKIKEIDSLNKRDLE